MSDEKQGVIAYEADYLRSRLKIGETITKLDRYSDEQLDELRSDGFKVERFDFGIEEVDITRLE